MSLQRDLEALLENRIKPPEGAVALAAGGTAGAQIDPAILEFVSQRTELATFANGTRVLGRDAHQVSYDGLARWLTWRAATGGAAVAAEDLVRYLDEPDFLCDFTLAIGGVIVDRAIDLADDVRLHPFSARHFFGGAASPMPFASMGTESLDGISAALTKRFRHPRLHVQDGMGRETDDAASTLEADAWMQLETARACISLAKPGFSVAIGNAIAIHPSVPASLDWTARSWYTDTRPPFFYSLRGELESVARDVHRDFLAMDERTRARLLVPMHRLERASDPYQDSVDVAIDLGIALEAALLDDDANGELAYRLSLRGACLLGHSAAERLEYQNQFKALYGMRSRAVHTGGILRKPSSRVKEATMSELLNAGRALAARILRRLIHHGREVDWDVVVLGPPGEWAKDVQR